jgi:hypothetical protein
MTDRRRFVRWGINRDLKVKLEGAEACLDCTIKDISFRGCNASLQLKLPKDQFLKLSIVLSDDSVINIEAWVAWHKTTDCFNCYGIYFSKIKDGDKEIIYQFIRRNFPHLMNYQWWHDTRKEGGEIMEQEKNQDRRIFDRFTAKFPLRLINLRENKESEALSDDVSAKGIGFTATQQVQLRTPLEMWLKIPDKGEPLYTRGEVVWSMMVEPNKYRIGVNLERADLMGLSRVLRVA